MGRKLIGHLSNANMKFPGLATLNHLAHQARSVIYHFQQNVFMVPSSASQIYRQEEPSTNDLDRVKETVTEMARMDYYLILTMCMSLLWGIFILLIGAILRFGLGQVIGAYVMDVKLIVNLQGTVNSAGQNICPVETAPSNDINLGQWSVIFGSLVVVTGTTVIIFSITGFVAGLKRSTFLLLLVLAAIFGACALEYYLLQVSTDYTNSFHDAAQSQLVAILQEEYEVDNTRNQIANTLNAIMLTGKCCGIRGPSDFKNITFTDEDQLSQTVIFTVAPACCQNFLFSSHPETFSLLKECAIEGVTNIKNINVKGCYETLFQHVYENYGYLIIVGLIVLSVWEMVQAVLTVLVLFTPPPIIKFSEKTITENRTCEHIELKPLKFVPYYKVSSHSPGELDRNRSTEIW